MSNSLSTATAEAAELGPHDYPTSASAHTAAVLDGLARGSHSSPNCQTVIPLNSKRLALRTGKRSGIRTLSLSVPRIRQIG